MCIWEFNFGDFAVSLSKCVWVNILVKCKVVQERLLVPHEHYGDYFYNFLAAQNVLH